MDGKIHSGPARLAALSLALSACGGGAAYSPPQLSPPERWNAPLEGGLDSASTSREALSRWWTRFGDERLDSLIERAVQGNLDLRDAQARLLEARARRGVLGADRFPTVDIDASYARERASENSAQVGGLRFETQETNLFDATFDARWELDVFGRVSRNLEAADAEIGRAQEDFRDVLVTLVAEIALNYVDLRSFQNRLSIAQSNISAQEDTLRLTRVRFDAGLVSALDVAQAETNLGTTRSEVPRLQIGLEQALNRLAVLIGADPGALDQEMSQARPIPAVAEDVAVGIPADILRQRPDIRRAEREVAVQTARLGVARAQLNPLFVLSGSLGLRSNEFEDLFEGGSRSSGFGPSLLYNVFNRKRLRQGVAVEDARLEQTVVRYENSVLTALEEVENSLVSYAREQVRKQSLQESVEASQRAVDLAETLYVRGLTDFQNVLDAQRSLFNQQDQLAASEGQVTLNLITLYKALGGGW